MSNDEEYAPTEPIESTDAAGAPSSNGASRATPADTLAALRDLESKPLDQRAPGYQELADRLRAELEHSDPSRGPS